MLGGAAAVPGQSGGTHWPWPEPASNLAARRPRVGGAQPSGEVARVAARGGRPRRRSLPTGSGRCRRSFRRSRHGAGTAMDSGMGRRRDERPLVDGRGRRGDEVVGGRGYWTVHPRRHCLAATRSFEIAADASRLLRGSLGTRAELLPLRLGSRADPAALPRVAVLFLGASRPSQGRRGG